MSGTNSMTKYERLGALYATLPTIECKRKCQDYCGIILIPRIEKERLETKRGWLQSVEHFDFGHEKWLPTEEKVRKNFVVLRPDREKKCMVLNPYFGTCMAYNLRPLICRLWGLMDNPNMRCPHGCVPTKWVTEKESLVMFEEVLKIQNES